MQIDGSGGYLRLPDRLVALGESVGRSLDEVPGLRRG
jgi:hypothetical protein